MAADGRKGRGCWVGLKAMGRATEAADAWRQFGSHISISP